MENTEYLELIKQWKEENKELISSGKCKKVFLECLPKRGKLISWSKSCGYKLYFIYIDIDGFIEIVKLNEDNISVTIKYNELEYVISTTTLSKCNIGRLLGKITSDFKTEIGAKFQDEKRDLTITDREYRNKKHGKSNVEDKWYKYTCNVCGWVEGWSEESHIMGNKKQGCSCCDGRTIVLGINTIWDTDRWIYDLGVTEEGAKTHTRGTHDKIKIICPDCGKIMYKTTSNIFKNKSIGCSCSDKISYGEKLMYSILKQLKLNFKTQLTKANFSWCDKYRYDFYFELNNKCYVIEVHGLQHYEECTGNWKNKLKEQKENDRIKKELALNNGIKEENYIVIDCRKSELEWIKNNKNGILNSKLNELFDLSNTNWLKAEEFTCSNLIKIACDYKRDNLELTTIDIGKIMGYNSNTICSWLKKGNSFGWCEYIAKDELRKSTSKNGKSKGRLVGIFKNDVFLKSFESSCELTRQSEVLFGVNLIRSQITMVCNGKRNSHHGFTFKYLTLEELLKLQLQAI